MPPLNNKNEFKRYLYDSSDNMSSSEHRQRLQQKEGSFLGSLMKIGAVATGVYGAYRSGLLQRPLGFLTRQAGKYKSRYVEAPIEGIKKWYHNKGSSQGVLSEISEEFTRRIQRESDGLNGRISEFENLLLEKERVIRQTRERVTTELRYNETMDYLHQEMSEVGLERLESELRQGPSGMRQLLNDPEFDKVMRETLETNDYDTFINRPDYHGESELERNLINQNTKFINQQYQTKINNKFSSNGVIEQATGLDRLTVRDLYERNLIGRNPIIETPSGLEDFDIRGQVAQMAEANPDIWDLSAGTGLFKDNTGNIVDLRDIQQTSGNILNSLTYDFKIPFVNFNPLQMLHIQDFSMARQAPSFTLINRGERQSAIADSPLGESLIYAGGKVQRLLAPEQGAIAEDLYLTSNRFGLMSRVMEELSGQSIIERDPRSGAIGKALDKSQNILDIFQQDTPSMFSDWKSFFTKFNDDNWIRNQTNNIFRDLPEEQFENTLNNVGSFLDSRSHGFSDEVWQTLSKHRERVFSDLAEFDLSDDEGVIDALRKLATDTEVISSRQYRARIKGTWNRYAQNPQTFKQGKRVISNRSALERLQSTKLVSNIDDTKKLISKEFIHRYGTNNADELISTLNRAHQSGNITGRSYKEAVDTITSTMFDDLTAPSISKSNEKVMQDAVAFLRNNSERSSALRHNIVDMVRRNAPIWQKGPSKYNIGNSSDWLIMRKAVGPIRATQSTNDASKFIQQFFAGRNNMADVTTATTIPFYMFERLNRGLDMFGLGLSGRSMSSTQALFGNMMAKRVLPVVAGITAYNYLSYEYENLTGKDIDDEASDMAARFKLDLARVRDKTGTTDFAKRITQLTPGGEQIGDIPGFNFFDPSMTEEELKEHLESGRDPIRRGRYWPFGNTPFTGGKIEYYAPNWYRRAQSDYQWTDVQHGSREEYWSRSPIPTPRYPLSPLRWAKDPYYYEKKHYWRRPYPLTSRVGYEIPLIGPTFAATAGEIIKPQKMMHTDELIAAAEGAESGEGPVVAVNTNQATGKYVVPNIDTESSIPEGQQLYYITPSGQGNQQRFITKGQGELSISEINKDIKRKARDKKAIAVRPRREQEESIEKPVVAGKPSSPGYLAGETYYRASEMAGFYGFGASEMTGQFKIDEPVLASADDINSWRRSFWDKNLGGLGGELSEIVRRFIPNRPYDQRENQINPIRNTMPEWMPGTNYYIDFRHGDPYTLVDRGEARLPGEGYEALNKLHSDKYGRYGAFDRFKILADVAPYSEEYEYWKEIVEQQDLSEDLRKEAAQIKREVSAKSNKRRVYPYRFKTANLKKEKVEVTKLLDNPNDFLVDKYPENPIRLAGVYISQAEDNETGQKAREYLAKRIAEGREITIGINADPLRQIRNDTYGTIHAVVYADGENINRELLKKGLAKEKEEDFSPTGVHARFSDSEIAFGRAWEFIAHRDTPINTKFLQVRSPLESYKRRDIYGKDWQSWSEPVSDFVVPTYQSFITKNPVMATGLGAFIGSLFGRTTKGKLIGAAIGGITVGLGALRRSAEERLTGEKWIPERIEEKRQINEYFDILEYVKYKGLYEKTLDEASEQDINVEKIINNFENAGEEVKAERDELKAKKRELYRKGTSKAEAEITKINERLKELANEKKVVELDKYTEQALEYKERYESTLYGAQSGTSLRKIFGAIPDPERHYFTDFLNATEEERDEIEELVPRNVKRILQRHWGKEPEDRPKLENFFKEYYLPDPKWRGWNPDVNLENVKIKVIENTAQDLKEYGYWDDDVQRANQSDVPDLQMDQSINPEQIKQNLHAILQGEGLDDIIVELTPVNQSGYSINVNLTQDKRQEIQERINSEDFIL